MSKAGTAGPWSSVGLCTLLAILIITLVGPPDLMVIPVFYINASESTTRENIVGHIGQEKKRERRELSSGST